MDVIGYKPTDKVERHSLVFYPFCNMIKGSLADKAVLSIFFTSIQDSYVYEPWASCFAGYTGVNTRWYSDFLQCSTNTIRKSLRHLIDNGYIGVCCIENSKGYFLTNTFKEIIRDYLYKHKDITGCDINPKIYEVKSSLNADIDD